MRIGIALLLTAALAGCGDERREEPRNNVTSIQVADATYVAQLRQLDDTNRTLTLRRAVIDSGNSCRRSESSKEMGRYENMTVFNLRCDRTEWAVFIAPSGDVQVRSCAHVRQLGLPGCGPAEDQPTSSNSTKS